MKFIPILLKTLQIFLNKYHNLKWDQRAWKLYFGFWLIKFITITYDRWRLINDAYEEYEITNTSISFKDPSYLYTSSRSDLSKKCKEEDWNKILFDIILINKNIKYEKDDYFQEEVLETNNYKIKFKNLIKLFFKNKFTYKFLKFIKKNDKIAICSNDINLNYLLKLKIKNKSIPFPDLINEYNEYNFINNINFSARDILKIEKSSFLNDFQKFLYKILPYAIPSIYLENFKNISNCVGKSAFPKKPKIILSKTQHWDNDVFKLWLAKQVFYNDAKLYIVQHGGEYRTALWSFGEKIEKDISNFFLKWGNNKKEDIKRSISIPIIENKYFKSYKKYNNKGPIVVILSYLKDREYMSNMHPYNIFGKKCLTYRNSINELIFYLKKYSKKNIEIRPYQTKKK